jgi:hypothetical protein
MYPSTYVSNMLFSNCGKSFLIQLKGPEQGSLLCIRTLHTSGGQKFLSFSVHGIDESRVADPHHFNADPGPDPIFIMRIRIRLFFLHFNADPDPPPHQWDANRSILSLYSS